MKVILIGINSKYIHPATGIFQLVANTNREVSIKEYTIKDDINKIVKFVNNFDGDLIGFSCYIWNIELIKSILLQINTKAKILLGGPEASFDFNNLLTNYPVDYLIFGEGEESFNELLNSYETNSFFNVPNLYYKTNSIQFTFTKLPNLNNVKHDLSLINDYENKVCYIEASRGCYFNCTYCLASLEKPVRFFPLQEVFNNLLFLLNRKAKIIKFLDRSFNVNNKYAYEILKFLSLHDNNYTKVQIEVVGDLLSKEIIDLLLTMRKGYIRLEIGVQTLNPNTLKAINRKQDFNLLKKNVLTLLKTTTIHTDLIAGLPYEDFASFKNTFNNVFKLFSDELQLGFLKELKGTVISKTKNIHEYVFTKEAPYEVIQNKYITSQEIEKIKIIEKGVDKFYNSKVLERTMKYLFLDLKLDPFDTFYLIMNYINNKENNISFSDSIKYFYESLIGICPNKELLLFLIKQDYLSRTKIKPKIWWDYNISKKERFDVYKEILLIHPDLNQEVLYNYSRLEKYIDNSNNNYINYNYYYVYIYKYQKEIFYERKN